MLKYDALYKGAKLWGLISLLVLGLLFFYPNLEKSWGGPWILYFPLKLVGQTFCLWPFNSCDSTWFLHKTLLCSCIEIHHRVWTQWHEHLYSPVRLDTNINSHSTSFGHNLNKNIIQTFINSDNFRAKRCSCCFLLPLCMRRESKSPTVFSYALQGSVAGFRSF